MTEFGYFGTSLHSAVVKARVAPAVPAAPSTPGFNAGVLRSAVSAAPPSPSPSVLRPGMSSASSNPRTLLMSGSQAPQKQYVLVSRPPAPTTVNTAMFLLVVAWTYDEVDCVLLWVTWFHVFPFCAAGIAF